MPSIAEILAARQQAASGAEGRTGASDGAKKPPRSGVTIRAGEAAVKQATVLPDVPLDLPGPRSLGSTTGEAIDLTPAGAGPETVTWHQALMAYESQLVITNDPDPRNESAWLAVMVPGQGLPILLHRLPFRLHPWTQHDEDAPF